ncbi:related to 37S ribosomal protein MRP4, mitochondrial [Saccharomycodes ludwigii]|uniref:Related to 37S ribosomal protein MRP4, mitochondrial n=1 Tax=Saccharomycodes ludwigii TaxID=36035 RepID=A0A376B611_9ASCO|nr:hypothetical protein SCDLUD_004106 [Saccharomycodes ludwigii]KAH3899813.1 hypothetical protein SCDLUD_004106 [Saccharomycodes ludwigii]SSD60071.1 related to 37S ribosomal protein MRP4, mitochondrial [Saccharomycodes ludwigii]
MLSFRFSSTKFIKSTIKSHSIIQKHTHSILSKRFQSTVTNSEATDSLRNKGVDHNNGNSSNNLDKDDRDLSILRMREFNEQVIRKYKELQQTPIEELGNLDDILNAPLTEKEKLLDQELYDFFKKYAVENKILKIDEPSLNVGSNTSDSNGAKAISSSVKDLPFLVPTPNDKPYSFQELYLRQMKHIGGSGKLGAKIKDVYFSNADIYNPPSIQDVTIEKLIAAGVHLGQSTSLWRSSTQSFIYGEYKGVHIIDLNQTLSSLKRACRVVEGIVERGGIILFLGTRKGQKKALKHAAEMTHGYYVSDRWIPGTLTNPTEISGVWERHKVDMFDRPTGETLSPEDIDSLVKPDLLIVLNPTENKNALREAMKTRIPTIGIIDTDSEPSMVSYSIPGNDDSLRSVNLITSVLAKAGEMGLKRRLARRED